MTAAWRAVVGPNVFLFISLLVVFEGGRRCSNPEREDGGPGWGLLGAIGFHLALWLFGWGVTIYALIMLPASSCCSVRNGALPTSQGRPSLLQQLLPTSKWAKTQSKCLVKVPMIPVFKRPWSPSPSEPS